MIRVLVADDHLVMRLGLEMVIGSAPDLLYCGSADNGVTAVSLALETVPDVVVFDVGMPGGDGIEATRRIREVLPNTGVLVLTALPWSERRARAAGADAFLLKNVDPKTLIEHIRLVAPQQPRPSPSGPTGENSTPFGRPPEGSGVLP